MACKHLWITLGILAFVAGCQTGIDEGVEVDLSGEDPIEQVNTEGGFNEREPDTCGAEDFQTALGQSREIIPGLGVSREIRIISPGDIVTQEYNPLRMNFYVNGNGIITRVTCG